MGGIQMGRVVSGGLLAGLVFNVGETILNAVILAEPAAEMAKAHNLRQPGGADIGIFVLLGFAFGILMTWFYAAVRPRLGPGPRTAALVGAALWFPAYFIPSVSWVVLGISPLNLAVLAMAWGLGELVLSALAGGWAYKED